MSYFPAAQSTKNGESTGIIGDYYVFLGALKQIHDIPKTMMVNVNVYLISQT